MTGGSAADIDELLAASATDELDLLKEKFARVIEAQKNAKSGDLSTIEWLGRTEGVQSEAIAMGLLKIQKKETAVTADESGDVDRDAWMTSYVVVMWLCRGRVLRLVHTHTRVLPAYQSLHCWATHNALLWRCLVVCVCVCARALTTC